MMITTQLILLFALICFETLAYMPYRRAHKSSNSRVRKYTGSSRKKTLAELFLGENALQGRITGGIIAVTRKIPHQLYFTHDDFFECGASLVEVYAVHIALTATHCLWLGSPSPDTLRNPENLKVFAGVKTLSGHNPDKQSRGVVKLVAHPNYDGEYWTNDITIMFLSSNFEQTENVEPLILPGFDWDLPSQVFISGFGSELYGGPNSDRLQFAVLPVLTPRACRSFNKYKYNRITDDMFCAGYLNPYAPDIPVGSCRGDSGGPVAAWNITSDMGYLAGIISFGITKVCGDKENPSVYTRISKYTDWIRIEVSKFKEETGRR